MRWIRAETGSGARQAAGLFVAVGVFGVVNDALVASVFGGQSLLSVALDVLNIVIGLAAHVLPWRRLPPRVQLTLPVLAFANLSVNIGNGFLPTTSQGIWLVLVFVWIGQWQPRGTSAAMAPVAALAYCLPFATGTPLTSGAVTNVTLSVLVSVLVGETMAAKERKAELATAGQEEALELLAAASLTDDLTGLGNRRQANALLDSLRPTDALAILDLDHFKQVNDSYGHQRGDKTLQELGHYLRSAVRDADRVARFGGEEFVVILREAGPSAPETVDRLLSGWRATRPTTTLSAGVAVHHRGATYAATFAKADQALYRAKEDGRDRLVVHVEQLEVHPT